MTTIRAIIAEDEPILAMTLAHALQRLWPECSIIQIAENGPAAVQSAYDKRPDILFLDIKMPGQTGLEVAQELAEDWSENHPFPLIVFVTAYDEYALDAFEQAAVDYLCKPVSDERLSKTITRLKERLTTRLAQPPQADHALEQLAHRLSALMPAGDAATPRLTMIRAAVGNQVRMIPVEDVIYFEATDKYVNVVTKDSESLIRTSLKELSPQLGGNQFWQIHRGTIVNARCIAAAVRDEFGKLSVKLHGRNETLAVSRVYAHLFRQM